MERLGVTFMPQFCLRDNKKLRIPETRQSYLLSTFLRQGAILSQKNGPQLS